MKKLFSMFAVLVVLSLFACTEPKSEPKSEPKAKEAKPDAPVAEESAKAPAEKAKPKISFKPRASSQNFANVDIEYDFSSKEALRKSLEEQAQREGYAKDEVAMLFVGYIMMMTMENVDTLMELDKDGINDYLFQSLEFDMQGKSFGEIRNNLAGFSGLDDGASLKEIVESVMREAMMNQGLRELNNANFAR